MNPNEKEVIENWQEKVRANFGEEGKLYQYLFETMDNFYYRYLETTEHKNLKTTELTPGTWGAVSYETDMMVALKVTSPESKPVIMELAKTIPKAQGPKIHYSLKAKVLELTAERGHLVLEAEVYGLKSVKKAVVFKYLDLGQFRKELALKLEEVCELFA